MSDQPTCGEGLAEYSALPAKLGELIASVAETLEVHSRALGLEDANAEREHGVYLELVREHREIAARLTALAEELEGYRNLPIGRHDEEALSSPAAVQAFERFVAAEQELAALVQERLERDLRLLGAMRA
jgi:hypothetical protein